ncbi:hypothetical protein TWF696_009850 [Orbilia brochopaga]|uniref:GPI anchored serine-threonine rich protein n=1 Tax=Orbilia brochopaga TaxID=3140254 RepID=A0AAV9UBR3_9PEZI
MRFTTVLSVAAVAGVSMAQTTLPAAAAPTPSSSVITGGSSCAAQNVLVACLGTQQSRMSSCSALDYGCQCQMQSDVLGCYNQCPSDPGRASEDAKLTALCVAASATMTKTTSPTSTGTYSVQRSSSTDDASPTDDSSDDSEPTGSSSSPSDSDGSSNRNGNGRSSPTTTGGSARASGSADSAATKITWMCASSLLAVLTAAFMVL